MSDEGNLIRIPISSEVTIEKNPSSVDMTPGDQFNLMKTFFNKKLNSLKRELSDTVSDKIKKPRTVFHQFQV